MIVLDNFNVYFGIVINAIFTGLGVAIGTYLANNHIIKHGKKMFKRVKLGEKRQ